MISMIMNNTVKKIKLKFSKSHKIIRKLCLGTITMFAIPYRSKSQFPGSSK